VRLRLRSGSELILGRSKDRVEWRNIGSILMGFDMVEGGHNPAKQ
jgi:hypothetical protein